VSTDRVAISVFEQCKKIAEQLEIPGTLEDVASYFAAYLSASSGVCASSSTVSEDGLPFEVSISTQDPHSFRILAEVKALGEPLILGVFRNIAFVEKLRSLSSYWDRATFLELCEVLFPEGEAFAQLPWKFSFYTALRTTGAQRELRLYFNLQWGSSGNRYVRILRALGLLGYQQQEAIVRRLPPLLAGWGDIVGISFDISEKGMTPAKIHFSIAKHSRYRLHRLASWTETTEQLPLAEWFLGFGSSEYPIPYLISIALSGSRPSSVKYDLVLRELGATSRHSAINSILARLTDSPTRNCVEQTGALLAEHKPHSAIQYVGLSLSHSSSYLNFYYSPSTIPCTPIRTESSPPDLSATAIERLQMQSGGFEMQTYGLSVRKRSIPEGWGDIYVTCLLHQESRRLHVEDLQTFKSMCLSFITARRDNGVWRYLPNLTPDVDDSAMALISLDEAGQNIPDSLLLQLERQQLPSGGFRTFFDLADDPEHVAVTINACQALWSRNRRASLRGIEFIRNWLEIRSTQHLQWMYSPLLALFLLARNFSLFGLGPSDRSLIIDFVAKLRRSDGLWGTGAEPESLETALALTIYTELGELPDLYDPAKEFLRTTQHSIGGWSWAPIFSDGDGNWFGHAALTTLFCASALRGAAPIRVGMD
jgi:hypothetical protein